jgi:outer membrane protein
VIKLAQAKATTWMRWLLPAHLLLWPPLLAAQATNVSVRSLSLIDCIRIAVENNFDVQIEQKDVDRAERRVSLAYGEYDPVFRGDVVHAKSETPGGIDDQNRPFVGTETKRDAFIASIDGLVPGGLEYRLAAPFVDSHGTGPSGPFENTAGSVGIELRQPLLKNFWIDGPRLNIKVNKSLLKTSELGLRSQLMEIVARVELAYYDLLLAREAVKVQEQALKLAQELLTANRERIKQGVMAALDEKQAESQVSAQRSLRLLAERAVNLEENILKGLLSDNFVEWEDVAIEPAGDLAAAAQAVDRKESWKRGLAMRPDFLQLREEVERFGYIVRYTHNQLFPQLDVVGSYGYNASEREFSGAFGQIRDQSSPFYSYGLRLTVPLERRIARESYKISKIDREQALLRLRQMEQDVLLQIDDAVKVVETNWERVGTTREAREFAEVALQAEQTKMENGKSTSFFVLQFQRDLTAARSEEIRALAEYNKALAQLALREGSILQRHRLETEIK